LGSSFAAPLISGMAALMRSRNELSAYRELSRLAALGDALLGKLDHSVDNDWSDRRDGVIDRLYVKAINGQPHPHLHPDHQEVCPECGLFAASAYVNFGLFKLNWGDLDGAEPLLRAAGAFAPWSPHAAANMGVALALRARQAQEQNRWSDVSRLLIEAADLQQKALDLRPDSQSYRARVEEFRAGAQDPQRWIMQP
jgi:hypothetical protein